MCSTLLGINPEPSAHLLGGFTARAVKCWWEATERIAMGLELAVVPLQRSKESYWGDSLAWNGATRPSRPGRVIWPVPRTKPLGWREWRTLGGGEEFYICAIL